MVAYSGVLKLVGSGTTELKSKQSYTRVDSIEIGTEILRHIHISRFLMDRIEVGEVTTLVVVGKLLVGVKRADGTVFKENGIRAAFDASYSTGFGKLVWVICLLGILGVTGTASPEAHLVAYLLPVAIIAFWKSRISSELSAIT